MTTSTTADLEEQERIFYDHIREYLISFTILIVLYQIAYSLISTFSRPRDELGDDDTLVYRVSTWLCTFTLAISIGAALLLPFSLVISCLTPEWAALTSSLLCGLWNYVFLFSNMSLFVILPFAYFFTESEGFSGSQRGIMARLRETLVLLILLSILVLGLTYIVCCCIGCQSLTVWQYLPFLYSCMSFIGVLLLLLCTPRGITHLFTLLAQMDTIKSRNTNYAFAMIVLLALTLSALLLVFLNVLELLLGYKTLPMAAITPTFEQIKILSRRGPLGASLETVLILYLWCASLVGLYNLPLLSCLRPRPHNTSFNGVIGNCTVLCLLSSGLLLLFAPIER
ncbi:Limb region 1 protein-like protein, partial [Fragariocoptes setiger]